MAQGGDFTRADGALAPAPAPAPAAFVVHGDLRERAWMAARRSASSCGTSNRIIAICQWYSFAVALFASSLECFEFILLSSCVQSAN